MKFWSNSKWYWVRWILVLPAAILAYTAMGFIVNIVIWVSNKYMGGGEDGMRVYVGKCMASAIGCYWFIMGGVSVAPIFKKYTALALMIILLIVTGMMCLLTIRDKRWGDLVILLVGVGGLIGAYVKAEEVKEEVMETED